MFYRPTIPTWFQKINSNLVWRIPTKEKELYLTFDDGPHAIATPFALDTLKSFNAKATFFCIGKNVKTEPEIYQRILNEGHAVGNHTYNHLDCWKTKNNIYAADVGAAAEIIHTKLFRPPYGKISPFISKTLRQNAGYKIIMWHILSGDFDESISPEKCAENVLLNAKAGSIIVFHDSKKAWPRMSYALPKILEYFGGKGFSFKSVLFV